MTENTSIDVILSNERCDLSSSLLTTEEQIQLMKKLETNNVVKELSLNFNELSFEVLEALSQTLKNNSTLKILKLSRTNLDNESISNLANALKENKGLEQLDLSFNALHDEGVEKISNSLLIQKRLTQLSLKYCSFSSIGAEVLGKFLSHDVPLEHLDITGNKIGDDGLHSLLNCFKYRTMQTPSFINELILWDIGITNKGSQNIIDALGSYPNHVKELILSGNPNISNEMGKKFLDLVLHNTQICRLELAGTGIHRKIQSQISATTAENAEIPQQEKEKPFEKSIQVNNNNNNINDNNMINNINQESNEISPSIYNNNKNYNHEFKEIATLREQLEHEKYKLKTEREEFNRQKKLWMEEMQRKRNWNEQREKVFNKKIEETQQLKEKLEHALKSVESQQKTQNTNKPCKVLRKVNITDSNGQPITLNLRFNIGM